MADDPESLLTAAENDVAAEVRAILDEVAEEFAAALADATELVAARFSVSRIAGMWAQRMPRFVRRLLGVTETAANNAADSVDAELPDGWDDLPGRYDAGTLPEGIGAYVDTTEHLMRAVGERLSARAVDELAAGLDAGEDIDQLRARLRTVFDTDGAQLGETREERIARTESGRAWNTAILAAARELAGPDRPLVKQWVTRRDSVVRDAHDAVDGQLRLIDEAFTVAGVSMQAPLDPAAPASLVVNCRCRLALEHAPDRAASLRIGDAGRTPSCESTVTASAEHKGAMIALVPSEEDIARLALDGGEDPEELHCTGFYLTGDATTWTDDQRTELINGIRSRAAALGGPVRGRLFGVNHWNPGGEDPVWVWAVSDDADSDGPTLHEARLNVQYALEDTHGHPDLPYQHSPWVAHITGVYTKERWPLDAMAERLGNVTFDRIRVAFGGEVTDIPLTPTEESMPERAAAGMPTRAWSTPDDTAIAFEDEETGDGRIFAANSLYWQDGPWPLQYVDEMGMGHDGAELAGAMQEMGRDGKRITSSGVIYANRYAGADAIALLEEEAPLGISVDLDDVSVEFVDNTITEGEDGALVLAASLPGMSVLQLADGAYMLSARTAGEWTADGGAVSRSRYDVQLFTNPGGLVPGAALRAAFAGTGVLTAAAGDADNTDEGVVVHQENAGDWLVRITRARVRGATLVAMPAYNRARIVLDPASDQEAPAEATAVEVAASADVHDRVIAYVRSSPVAVGSREVASILAITMSSARGHLNRAAKDGHIVRLAPGQYAGSSTIPEGDDLTAAMSGDLDLPVHDDREAEWDGGGAASRVLDWATADNGDVDPDKLGSAFLYRDPDADPAAVGSYKLGFADVFDGELQVVARGVFAVAGVLEGSMGGADIPSDEQDEIRQRVSTLYASLAKAFKDPSLHAPWDDEADGEGDEAAALMASAWTALGQLPPMPAAWFQEPTAEELPPGSGGVHVAGGRVYGWVAQAGEPHAGMPGRNLTIESLGELDMSHFLRASFKLDNGLLVRAGAMTMNVGHHRDGAECETDACQFDNTRTVAAIVTVGMSEGGLWFSGAAGPWLSEWDQRVFQGCQPSYHMKQGRDGRWQLRAVLTVPVPGHSSPLLAAAVERGNLALAASAAVADATSGESPDSARTASASDADTAADQGGQHPDTASGQLPDASAVAEAVVAAMLAAMQTDTQFIDGLIAAMDARTGQRAEFDAEIERLSAQMDPDATQLAAATLGGTKEGDR